MATKKAAKKSASPAKRAGKSEGDAASHSMPKAGKDPKGGLTAKGRAFFAKTEGAHLRPGVQGPADTPEKMVRKGSFLRRHFANPRGPMKDDKGEPTRLALSAHAWGEPVPKNMGDAKKLATEGHNLLEQYHELKEGAATGKKSPGRKAGAKGSGKAAAKSSPRQPTEAAARRAATEATKGAAARSKGKQNGAGAARRSEKSTEGKKAAAKKTGAKKTAVRKAPGKRVATKVKKAS